MYLKGNEGEPATLRLREARRDNMVVFSAGKLLWVASVLMLLLSSIEARKLATVAVGEEVLSGSSHDNNGELTMSEKDRANPSGPSKPHPPWDPPPQPRTKSKRANLSRPSTGHAPWDSPPQARTEFERANPSGPSTGNPPWDPPPQARTEFEKANPSGPSQSPHPTELHATTTTPLN